MAFSSDRIFYLLHNYVNSKATYEEEQELYRWVLEEDEQRVKDYVQKLLITENNDASIPTVDWEGLYERIIQEKNELDHQPLVRSIKFSRWAVAACILLIAGFAVYLFNNPGRENELLISHQHTINDIASPSGVHATLTLANGQRIILDTSENGVLAIQGAVYVRKSPNGQISYEGSSKNIEYNILSNPSGSRVINLILADGSKVWLNAASSLKYPTAFGKNRSVEISGEAYFEVAKDRGRPFKVCFKNRSGVSGEIEVLGTQFNVNAYEEEISSRTTLLEGSILISNSNISKKLSPRQQADLSLNKMVIKNNVNVEQVTAWKNGYFMFDNTDFISLMQEVAKWYNVEVVFEGKIPNEGFSGKIPRNLSLSQLVKVLELNNVNIRTKERKIIIKE